MGIEQYKTLLLVVTVILALFIASPAIQQVAMAPKTASLTEFSILGPFHNATYPYNITSGKDYSLYFEVDNQLGATAYYQIELKFRNETQSAPDIFNRTSSTLPSLGSLSLFAANKETIELPINISFQYKTAPGNAAQLDMQSITVNGAQLNCQTTLALDPQKGAFLGNVFFELWLFNDSTSSFQYNQRYVSLWMNMTH